METAAKTAALAAVWIATTLVAVGGQDPQAPTSGEVQARLDALQESEAPNKDELAGIYGQALQALERAKGFEQRAVDFERQTQEAPNLLKALREELAQPPASDDPPLSPETPLWELEQQLLQADANRVAAQKLVDDLGREAQHRSDRQGVLADDLARVRNTINEQETALRAATASDEVGVARRSLLLAESQAQRAEERSLVDERTMYEARRELLPLRREQAQRQLTRAEQLARVWQNRVSSKRQSEADQAAREAERLRRQTAARFPDLSEIATRNEELASKRSGENGIPAQTLRAKAALLAAQQLRDETARRYRTTRRKVGVGGLTEGMGLLLRREYEWTQTPAELRGESEAHKEELSRAQLLQITLQEERENAGDIASQHAALMAKLGASDPDASANQQSDLALELLTTQHSLLDLLIDELGALIGTLLEQERVHQELESATLAYRSYVEENILWVRSSVDSILPSPGDAVAGLAWLTSVSDWRTGIERSMSAARDRPGQSFLLFVLFAGLLVVRGRARRALASAADQVRSYRTDRFSLTAQAVVQTTALALPFPLLVWALGWLLTSPTAQVEVARSVGLALRHVALTYFVLEFLRKAAKEKSLGESHFRWRSSTTQPLRTELRWFMPIALPLEFLAITFDRQSSSLWNDSVGRMAFFGLLTALIIVLFRLFRPNATVLAEHYRRSTTLLERTHKLWFGLAVGVPVVLIALALAGYYYSALQFEARLRDSLGLAIVLILVNALALRWLFIARRRLAVEHARQRAQAKAQASAAEGSSARESGSVPIDEATVDIPAIDAQTRQLFRSGIIAATLIGLFFIWSGAFPALRALNQVQVWPKIKVVRVVDTPSEDLAVAASPTNGAATATPGPDTSAPGSAPPALGTVMPAGGGEAATPVLESGLPATVTLADLIIALVIFVLTGVATKNAPGVLEISILQRLPLDSGSRYTLSTLFRYLLLIVGVSAGFGAIGIGWNKIQWLAAALTFGLAFGLQEIFANFVSGIIILLERPVRVGDIVTVGETEGRVTRLRMRATTILDWDRRELLVPNKEFITGNVVNWTLSDPVTRMIVRVGIAYGSDTKRAHELLMQVATKHELVLADPAPSAIFRSFGESSLDFELRVFMAERDLWPRLVDDLHTQIDQAFREAGIEIAFPQRDLHIRSAEGLAARDESYSQTGRER